MYVHGTKSIPYRAVISSLLNSPVKTKRCGVRPRNFSIIEDLQDDYVIPLPSDSLIHEAAGSWEASHARQASFFCFRSHLEHTDLIINTYNHTVRDRH